MNVFSLKCLGRVFFSAKITGFSPRFGEKKTIDISEKKLFFGKNNGRFSNFGIKLTPQRFLFFCRLCRIHIVVFCWFSAFPLLAEFEGNDKTNLQNIQYDTNNISGNTESILELLQDALFVNGSINSIGHQIDLTQDNTADIANRLSYLLGVLGYGAGSSQTGTLNESLIAIKQQIADIYNYQKLPQDGAGYQNWVNLQKLPVIANSLGYTGGYQNTLKYDNSQIIQHLADIEAALTSSDSSTELLKEETFVEKFDAFTNSFGFSGGSGETYKDYLDRIFSYNDIYTLQDAYFNGGNDPFPSEPHQWYFPVYPEKTTYYRFSNPIEALSWSFSSSVGTATEVLAYNQQKQSWNDWQAHTNLVSTIIAQADRFFVKPEDTQKDATFSEGKLITPSSGTGSSDTEVDLRPVFTNDFTTIEEERDAFTNEFAFLSNEEIKQRYVSDTILETSNVQVYQDDSGGKWNTVVTIPVTSGGSFVIDFAQAYDKYRLMVTPDSLKRFRGIFEIFWYASCSIAAFFIVLKVSGISHDKGE